MLTFPNSQTFTSSSQYCASWRPSLHDPVTAIESSRRSRNQPLPGKEFAAKYTVGYSRHLRDCNRGRQLVNKIPSYGNRWQRDRAGGRGLAYTAQPNAVLSDNHIPVESSSSEAVSGALQRRASGLVEPIGVVIVDHGSRRQASNNLLRTLNSTSTGFKQSVFLQWSRICKPTTRVLKICGVVIEGLHQKFQKRLLCPINCDVVCLLCNPCH